MRRVKLDRIDRRILRDLQADGRMTNVDLARRAGISAPPCLRRVRALEEAGFIRGYHADINPKMMGYEVTVFAQVGLMSQAETDLRRFEETVGGWPQVRECHMLAGETDTPRTERTTSPGKYSAIGLCVRATGNSAGNTSHSARVTGSCSTSPLTRLSVLIWLVSSPKS